MRRCLFILFAFVLCFPTDSFCQKKKTRAQVEAESKKTKKDIERTSKLLKETEQSKSISIERVTLLSQQIEERNNYVNSLQQEIDLIEDDITATNSQILTLSNKLQQVQEDYNKTLFTMYKVKSQYEQLIFVLSADNFNQAYNRIKYLQYYSDYMIAQSNKIKALQDSLNVRKYDLEQLLSRKKNLVGEKQSEARKLEQDKYLEGITIKKLTSKQQDLRKKLAEKQALAKKLDKQIEDLIKAEIAAKKKAAEAKNKAANTKTTTESTLTPEEKLISKNFSENKGRLPWPTATGKITSHFGRHKHPTLEYVEVDNSGVDIATVKGARARAIFDGVVSQIVLIPGRNTAVLIKHGDYYTVYDNLVSVTVRVGQEVKAKQEIGTIYTDPETNSTVLGLQIWQQLVRMDPEPWLSK